MILPAHQPWSSGCMSRGKRVLLAPLCLCVVDTGHGSSRQTAAGNRGHAVGQGSLRPASLSECGLSFLSHVHACVRDRVWVYAKGTSLPPFWVWVEAQDAHVLHLLPTGRSTVCSTPLQERREHTLTAGLCCSLCLFSDWRPLFYGSFMTAALVSCLLAL